MINISVKSDIEKAIKKLNDIQKKQVPFASALALTKVGQLVKDAEYAQMKKAFDRPTNFTLNSLFLRRATKKSQEAVVWLRDWAPKGTPANKYLGPQIYSGSRSLKGFERLLNAKGVLPDGYYAIPSRKARKDAHGNLNKGLLNQILSYSGAQRDGAQNTKQGKKRQTKAKFMLLDERDGKPGGIWAITSDQRIYPVLIFVRAPSYKRRFDFYRVAARTYRQHMAYEFDKALAQAMRTAR